MGRITQNNQPTKYNKSGLR